MSSSQVGRSGRGSKIYISNMATSPTWTLIEGAKALDLESAFATVEAGDFGGPDEVPGDFQPSNWPIQVNFNPESLTGQKKLIDAHKAQQLTNFTIGIPKRTAGQYYYVQIAAYVDKLSGSLAPSATTPATYNLRVPAPDTITWGATFTPPS